MARKVFPLSKKPSLAEYVSPISFLEARKSEDFEHSCDERCYNKFPIHWSARRGELDKFKLLVEDKAAHLKRVDCQGCTIFHHIAMQNLKTSKEMAEILITRVDDHYLDRHFLDIKDAMERTALHYAATTGQADLIEKFIKAGASPHLKDCTGDKPLHKSASGNSLEYVRCTELLLDVEDNVNVQNHYGQNALHVALSKACNPPLVELLLSRGLAHSGICDDTNMTFAGSTVLHYVALWANNDLPENVQCIDKLLAFCTYEDVNARAIGDKGKTPLHVAASQLSFRVIAKICGHEHTNIFAVDDSKSTALHIVAHCGSFGWPLTGVAACKAILECDKLTKKDDKVRFLDMRDSKGETALEIAVKADCAAISQTILMAHPEPPEDWIDVTLQKRIYEKVPEIMLPLMDSSIVFEQKNYDADDEKFETRLGAVIGFKLNDDILHNLNGFEPYNPRGGRQRIRRETDLLSILLKSKDVRKDEMENVMDHPIVELFVMEKWKKLRGLFWISFFFHIIWILLYATFVITVFWVHCPPPANFTSLGEYGCPDLPIPDIDLGNGTNETTTPSSSYFNYRNRHHNHYLWGQRDYYDQENGTFIEPPPLYNNMGCGCYLNIHELIFGYTLVGLLLFLWSGKTIIQLWSIGIWRLVTWQNVVHIIFTTLVCATVLTVCLMGAAFWHYWVTSLNIIIAAFIALWHIRKIPSLGLYADVFLRACKKMFSLMVAFSPIILGFTLAISLVLPENPSFPHLYFSIVKILVMLIGEINYDDIFYESRYHYMTPFRTYAIILYAFFIIIVTIVMFNLLLGFTISDIQALEARSEKKLLYSTLKQVIVLEKIIMTYITQAFVPKRILRLYLVITDKSYWDGYPGSRLRCRMDDMPPRLRRKVRSLAKEQELKKTS